MGNRGRLSNARFQLGGSLVAAFARMRVFARLSAYWRMRLLKLFSPILWQWRCYRHRLIPNRVQKRQRMRMQRDEPIALNLRRRTEWAGRSVGEVAANRPTAGSRL